MNITATIRERLAPFQPVSLDIVDDSPRHAGHAGAVEHGGGHYELTIVSQAFAGKPLIERHRMVYNVLSDLIPHNIHALKIAAHVPDLF